MKKTIKQRQAEFKKRMREAGLSRMEIWVHPDKKDQVKRYVERLNQQK